MAQSPPPKDASVISEAEQQKLLEEAKKVVQTQAFLMNRCLDNNNLMDALKHASNMICELRTSLLSPRNYYSLYIETYDHLRNLEQYLLSEKHGKRMAELYELVQYAGNILPRLYLLCTVGSAYIKLKEAPAKDVLKDIVEMCRGVQHPTRGLFLRTYLSEMTKDKMPDKGSPYEGRGGSVRDSIEFILQNFTEMNKLWVRMQHQGPAREKEKREAERAELRLLVGKNIARLSQLDGVDLELYSKIVLPRLLEQVIHCRDAFAQQYLMECIIQAFPDDFHLRTLEPFLSACAQLAPGVTIKTILVSLLDRLADFASKGETIPADVDVFAIFSSQVAKVVESQTQMPVEDILALEASLVNLSIICYPKALENVNQIFKFCAEVLSKKQAEEYQKNTCVKQIMKLLTVPLETYKNILTVLNLEHYQKLLGFLQFTERRRVAIDVAQTAINFGPNLSQEASISRLLEFIDPLIKDQPDQKEIDKEEFEEEQNLVASLLNLIRNDKDDEELFAMYLSAKKAFSNGGAKRQKHTFIPVVFGAFKLVMSINKKGGDNAAGKIKKVFKFIHETVTALSRTNLPELSLRLFLQCAVVANKCGAPFETVAYEFISQAFVIYEQQISDSQEQFNAITLIIGTLHTITIFTEENSDPLITKTALHSSKLVKKPDQCRAVCRCSHLFYRVFKEYSNKNPQRVLECLQRSLKIADTCMDAATNIRLFVEILNEYLFYYEKGCESVTNEQISQLIQLINTNMSNLESNEDSQSIISQYNNTLNFVRAKVASGVSRYSEIKLSN